MASRHCAPLMRSSYRGPSGPSGRGPPARPCVRGHSCPVQPESCGDRGPGRSAALMRSSNRGPSGPSGRGAARPPRHSWRRATRGATPRGPATPPRPPLPPLHPTGKGGSPSTTASRRGSNPVERRIPRAAAASRAWMTRSTRTKRESGFGFSYTTFPGRSSRGISPPGTATGTREIMYRTLRSFNSGESGSRTS